jgi:hypothetical protein
VAAAPMVPTPQLSAAAAAAEPKGGAGEPLRLGDLPIPTRTRCVVLSPFPPVQRVTCGGYAPEGRGMRSAEGGVVCRLPKDPLQCSCGAVACAALERPATTHVLHGALPVRRRSFPRGCRHALTTRGHEGERPQGSAATTRCRRSCGALRRIKAQRGRCVLAVLLPQRAMAVLALSSLFSLLSPCLAGDGGGGVGRASPRPRATATDRGGGVWRHHQLSR